MTTLMSSPTRVLFVLTVLLLRVATWAHAGQVPEQSTLRVGGDRVSAELRAAGMEGETRVFEITLLVDGTTKVVHMKNGTIEATRLVLGDAGTLLVVGLSEGRNAAVTVVDMRAGTVRDYFVTHDWEPSPDGRYAALVVIQPPWPRPTNNVIAIYDVRRGAIANRPPRIAPDDPFLVGSPVFPAENVRLRTLDALHDETRSRWHAMYERFNWLAPDVLAFRDCQGEKWPSLVVVDLQSGPDQPKVHVKRLDVAGLVHLDRLEPGHSACDAFNGTQIVALEVTPRHLSVRLVFPRSPALTAQNLEFDIER